MTEKMFWRTLIRIEKIWDDVVCQAIMHVWDHKTPIYFPLDRIEDKELRKEVAECKEFPIRVGAKVDISSNDPRKFVYKEFERMPDPTLDGLA